MEIVHGVINHRHQEIGT